MGTANFSYVDDNGYIITGNSMPFLGYGISQADAEFEWKQILLEKFPNAYGISIQSKQLPQSYLDGLKNYLNG